MKYLIQIVVFLLLSNFSLRAQQFSSPIEYFDYINEQHMALSQKNLEYLQYSVHSDDLQLIEEKRFAIIKQLAEAVIRIGQLPPYDGDAAMKDEMLKVLEMYISSFEVEYKDINHLKARSLESFEAMEEYLAAEDAAEKKLAEAAELFRTAQEHFAQKHNIQLKFAEENSEIAQINKLNDYYRSIFLRQFKVSKLDAIFWDAVEKKDPKEMEKARLSLLSAAKSESKKLSSFPAFNDNTSFRDAAKDKINFLESLAEKNYKTIITVTTKPQEQLTQEDVDEYNNTINTYNQKNQEYTDKYNSEMDKLFKANIPRPGVETRKI